MRLAFMGTPDFAVPALRALHGAGHDILAVYSQPPRPAGRGQAVRRSPVHVAADELRLEVRTPARLRRDTEAHKAFAALDLDAAVVAAYGLILPAAMLAAPRRGCLNIHASLLPRWRGAAPIQAAILAGDAESGVTVMQMDEGLDTGAMLLSQATPITPATTASALHDALSTIGAALILRALDENPPPVPQPEAGVTYAAKLDRADGKLVWTEPADAMARRVRALNPWPGTFCVLDGEGLKVLAAEPVADTNTTTNMGANPTEPGTVLDEALLVATGAGALRLTRVQAAGRAAMDAAAFLRGRRVAAGTRLE
jgi:methionyl-tRNA formyltransferase